MLFNKNIYKFFKPEIELSSPHRSARNDKLDSKSMRCMKYVKRLRISLLPLNAVPSLFTAQRFV